MRSPALLLALLTLSCLLLVGCGGGSPSSPPTEVATGPSAPTSSGPALPVGPLKVSGGGAGQFTVKGGDNSVEEYGEEAGATELRQVAESVHSFFVARVREEWTRACALLDASVRQGLEKLAAQSLESKGKGCPGGLATATKPISPVLARDLTTMDAAALRHEGERAYLIYTGPPGQTVYAMPLVDEDDTWMLGAIDGVVLPGVRDTS